MNRDLVVFSGALGLVTLTIGIVTIQYTKPSFLVLILASLSVATWLVYFFIQRTSRENLVKNYMLSIVVKLLIGGIFIFFLLYADKSGANTNAILFMGTYFLLTALEVGFLFRRLE